MAVLSGALASGSLWSFNHFDPLHEDALLTLLTRRGFSVTSRRVYSLYVLRRPSDGRPPPISRPAKLPREREHIRIERVDEAQLFKAAQAGLLMSSSSSSGHQGEGMMLMMSHHQQTSLAASSPSSSSSSLICQGLFLEKDLVCGGMIDVRDGCITNLFTSPPFRGRGFERMVLSRLLEVWGRQQQQQGEGEEQAIDNSSSSSRGGGGKEESLIQPMIWVEGDEGGQEILDHLFSLGFEATGLSSISLVSHA